MRHEFTLQHNGKGKYHLIGDVGVECGLNLDGVSNLNFTKAEVLILDENGFHEEYNGSVCSGGKIFAPDFCKKCLIAARRKY